MLRGFDDAHVCFVLSKKGQDQLGRLLQDLASFSRREELGYFLRRADRVVQDSCGNKLWYYYDEDWTCDVPLSNAWYLHGLFTSIDPADVLLLVVNNDGEFRAGKLSTPLAPRVWRTIDFTIENVAEV